jgi:Cu(I)/Ag(I) efflux system membrane fusion protein
MSEQNPLPPSHTDGDTNGVPTIPAPRHGFWGKLWQVLQVVQARLRFVAILVAIGLAIGYWSTINNYVEKWTRSFAAQAAADSDVEYFCPMHPYIVRDNNREKCPICHMDLARRKKGSGEGDEPLPPGTVSRKQLTPYREVLADVQTAEVRYLPLARELTTFGSVEFDETKEAHIATTQKARILRLYVNYTGQMVDKGEKLALLDVKYDAELTSTLQDLARARREGDAAAEQMHRQRLRRWDISEDQVNDFLRTGKVNTQLTITSPIHGHVLKKYQREGSFVDEGTPLYDVADLDTVWVEGQVYEADQALVHEGQPISATTLSLPDKVFSGSVSFVYPHLDEATRTLAVRFELPNPGHQLRPGMYATVKVQVSPAQVGPIAQAAAGDAARQAQLEKGLVLAVPDSAVIDTGNLKIVYRESGPSTYDGVAVQLGPRLNQAGSSTAFYPVLSGLSAGDRVVVNGAFLVDAETRLNPAAGSIYYGGSGGKGGEGAVTVRPSTPQSEDALVREAKANLAKLTPEDRKLADAQKVCPITRRPLGSMGVPVEVALDGQVVLLCCSGCKDKAEADPAGTLAKLAKQGQPAAAPEDNAEVQANLAKLAPEDRRLAEAQKVCPVLGGRLGEMGVPVKQMLDGQPVFLCCKGCVKKARKEPEKTLAKVKELLAKKGEH